jgi:hypothetical protein
MNEEIEEEVYYNKKMGFQMYSFFFSTGTLDIDPSVVEN